MGLWGRHEAYTVEQVSDLLLNNAINTKRLLLTRNSRTPINGQLQNQTNYVKYRKFDMLRNISGYALVMFGKWFRNAFDMIWKLLRNLKFWKCFWYDLEMLLIWCVSCVVPISIPRVKFVIVNDHKFPFEFEITQNGKSSVIIRARMEDGGFG